MKFVRNVLLTSATLGLTVACGGGGDSDSGTPPLVGSAPIEIDAANAAEVSGIVVDATLGLQDVSGLVGFGSVTANKANHEARDLVSQTFRSVPVDETVACSFGGQLSISGNLQDAASITVGDSLASRFSSCNEGPVFNGLISFAVTGFTGDAQDVLSGRFAMAADVIITDFSIAEGAQTTIANGEFMFAIDTTSSSQSTLDMAGSIFSIDDSNDTLTLSDFDIAVIDNGSSYSYTTNGTVDSAGLQGSVSFQTLVTFDGVGDDYPFAGELRATGDNGSSVTLIAISSTDVRLEIDVDGDGAIDTVIDTTWQAIAE